MTTTPSRISQLKEMIALEEKRAIIQGQLDQVDAKLSEFQRDLYGATGSGRKSAATITKAPAGKRSGRRGALREQILQTLQAAGANGVTVRELASILNIKPANIHSWFSINAKKTSGLKKIGEAHYALGAGKAVAAATPGKPGRKPKAEKAVKAAKPGRPAKAPKAPKAAKAPKTGKVGRPAKVAKAPKAPKAPKAAKPAKAATQKPAAGGRIAGPAKRGELKTHILEELKNAGSAGVSIKDLSDKLGVKYKNLYIWFVTTGKRIEGIEKAGPARYRLA